MIRRPPRSTPFPTRRSSDLRKAAGSRTVVLQQEALVRQLVEQPFGDRVIAAFAMPHAALVAAAQVNAEGDAGKARDQRGVGLERAREVLPRVFAARAHRGERGLG